MIIWRVLILAKIMFVILLYPILKVPKPISMTVFLLNYFQQFQLLICYLPLISFILYYRNVFFKQLPYLCYHDILENYFKQMICYMPPDICLQLNHIFLFLIANLLPC